MWLAKDMMRVLRLVVLLWACQLPLAQAAEQELSSAHFVFRFLPTESKVARELADRAEGQRRTLCELLPLCPEGPITVQLTGALGEFLEQLPYPAHIDWASGVAYGDLKLIILRTDQNNLFTIRETFDHELSHVLLLNQLPHRPPRWLIEGIAIYQAGEALAQRFESLASAATGDSLMSLDSMAVSFPDSTAGRSLAYAQSAFFVSFLVGRFGEQRLTALIATLGQGVPFHVAFQNTYGESLSSVETRWKESFQRTAWMHVFTSDLFIWSALSVLFVVAILVAWRKRVHRKRVMAAREAASNRLDDGPDWEYRQIP